MADTTLRVEMPLEVRAPADRRAAESHARETFSALYMRDYRPVLVIRTEATAKVTYFMSCATDNL